jgi:phosphosulfolactate synthase (CoM biosynthesis protein A)
MKEEMVKLGWEEVAIDSGDHVQRMIEMYQELGFEIYLEEVKPEDVDRCAECYKATDEKLYRVYTRRKEESRK